jgi:hypothetical protein
MATELTEKNTGIAAADADGKLDGMIKPLTRDIHLFDTRIAGVTHLEDPSVLEKVSVDDRLILRREDNEHDERAILVLAENGAKLGYVPAKDNIVFSRLMDAGKLLTAKVRSVEKKGSYTKIDIGIYLTDF